MFEERVVEHRGAEGGRVAGMEGLLVAEPSCKHLKKTAMASMGLPLRSFPDVVAHPPS